VRVLNFNHSYTVVEDRFKQLGTQLALRELFETPGEITVSIQEILGQIVFVCQSLSDCFLRVELERLERHWPRKLWQR